MKFFNFALLLLVVLLFVSNTSCLKNSDEDELDEGRLESVHIKSDSVEDYSSEKHDNKNKFDDNIKQITTNHDEIDTTFFIPVPTHENNIDFLREIRSSGETNEIAEITTTLPPDPCEIPGYFMCDLKCIDPLKRCDHHNDCIDGTDELECDCAEGKFKCDNGNCVDSEVVCDRKSDCADDSDEKYCTPTTTVTHDSTTVPIPTSTPTEIKAQVKAILPEGPLKIPMGSPLELACHVKGTAPNLQALLYKGDKAVGETEGNAVFYRVSKATVSDAARYICYGFTEDRSTYDVNSVEVEIIPSTDGIQTYSAGENVELVCPIEDDTIDKALITWKRLDKEDNSNYHVPHYDKLYLYYVTAADTGEYACFYNDNKLFKMQIEVIDKSKSGSVINQPQADSGQTLSDIWYKEDDTIELTCNKPHETDSTLFVWSKIDGEMPLYKQQYRDKLFLYYVKPQDSGEYVCSQSGNEVNRIKVNIVGKDGFQVLTEGTLSYAVLIDMDPREIIQQGVNGENSKTCIGRTNGPNLIIDWYDNTNQVIEQTNEDVKLNVKKQQLDASSIEAILTINDATLDLVGNYECRVTVGTHVERKSFHFNISYECPIYERKCKSGECIGEYSFCDSLSDCMDSSDEDEEICGDSYTPFPDIITYTTLATPIHSAQTAEPVDIKIVIDLDTSDLFLNQYSIGYKHCMGWVLNEDYKDALKVEWYDSSDELITDQRTFTVNIESNGHIKYALLRITYPSSSDSGFYKCRVTNGIKVEEKRFHLYVNEIRTQPTTSSIANLTIYYPNTPVRLTEGSILEINCAIEGPIPSLEMALFHQINNTYKKAVGIQVGNNGLHYRLNSVRKSDEGLYECIGYKDNLVGTYNRIDVEIEAECRPGESKCSDGRCIRDVLFCDGVGDCTDESDEKNCPLSRGLSACNSTQFECTSGSQCIPKRYLCDGTPNCQDKSDESCSSVTFTQLPEANITVNIGGKVVLHCKASGFPLPHFSWKLNGGHVCREPRCRIENKDGESILTINDARILDTGEYVCSAETLKGVKEPERTTFLLVQKDEPLNKFGSYESSKEQKIESRSKRSLPQKNTDKSIKIMHSNDYVWLVSKKESDKMSNVNLIVKNKRRRRQASTQIPLKTNIIVIEPIYKHFYSFGSLISVKCEKNARNVTFKWSKANSTIDLKFQIFNEENSSIMTIPKFYIKHLGKYICSVQLNDGLESNQSIVFKKEKNQFVIEKN